MIDPAEIRAFRFKHDLSEAQLGSLVGVKQSAVSFWELGKRRPDPETENRLKALLRLPGVTPGKDAEDRLRQLLADAREESARQLAAARAVEDRLRRQLDRTSELPRRWLARRQTLINRLRSRSLGSVDSRVIRDLTAQAQCWYTAARELEDAVNLPEEVAS